MFKARVADKGDLPALRGMVKEFVEESGYGWDYSEISTDASLNDQFEDEYSEVLIIDGAGFACIGADQEFVEQIIGYVGKFYIRTSHRGTGAARELVKAMTEWFDAKGCWDSFATSTAGIDQEQLFTNLLGKYGYTPCGPTLKRSYHE